MADKKNPADAIGGLFGIGKRLIARRKALEIDDENDGTNDPSKAFNDPEGTAKDDKKKKKKEKKTGLEL
jgi:hypothetical protein